MVDGARLIALQAAVRWLSCSIFVLQQATPNTKRGTLEMSFKKKKRKRIFGVFWSHSKWSENKGRFTPASAQLHLNFQDCCRADLPCEHHLLLPLFCAYRSPLSCQRLVFFGRDGGLTSTGVVITMRTLLSPDYIDSTPPRTHTHTQCNNMKKILRDVVRKIE